MLRIVVHLRWCPPDEAVLGSEEETTSWASLAAPLVDRAQALGGRVVGWAFQSMAVDFSWDGLYDAVDFLVDAPLAPELASGICHGDVTVIHEGPRFALATGQPLRHAEQLAELARPGEVLVAPELAEASRGRIGSVGEAGKRPGRPVLPALVLDPLSPLRSSSGDALASFAPGAGPAESFSVDTSSTDSESPASTTESRFLGASAALGPESLFPDDRLQGNVARALEARDAESLSDLARAVERDESPELAERLDAMAELAKGRSGEAIRRLREAKEKAEAQGGGESCRAILSLAVALYSAGRMLEAAFEAIEALGVARATSDRRGERAAARLLAQLSEALEDRASAAEWFRLSA